MDGSAKETVMQDPTRASDNPQTRLSNPLLDLAVAGLEAQLKAWQAFQVEGTQFIAKRMRADLEYAKALCHCTEPQSMGECHRAWLQDVQKDYAEEWARIAATTFVLGFADLAGLGWLFGQRGKKDSQNEKSEQAAPHATRSNSSSRLATAA
jgi:hypothetical protein